MRRSKLSSLPRCCELALSAHEPQTQRGLSVGFASFVGCVTAVVVVASTPSSFSSEIVLLIVAAVVVAHA